MLSEGFQNPKIGFQNPRLLFFQKKNSLEHAQILSEDCQISFLPQIQPNNRVYLVTVCNAITVWPKPCGHPIFDIEYCNVLVCVWGGRLAQGLPTNIARGETFPHLLAWI